MRNKFEKSTESAKYGRQLFRSFRASRPWRSVPGATRLHFVRRLPLAVIFRAFGAALAVIFRAFGAGMPPGCPIPRLRRMPRAVIFRVFVAGIPRAVIFRAFGACLGLSYSAPSALALTAFLFKANNDH